MFRSLLVKFRKVYHSNNFLENAIEKDTISNNKYNKVVRINLQGMKCYNKKIKNPYKRHKMVKRISNPQKEKSKWVTSM